MAIDFMERLRNTYDVLVECQSMHTILVEEYAKPMEAHISDWVVAHPKVFQDAIQRAFAAGCDIVHIATQASSPIRARPFGVDDRIYELNYKPAKLAKEVAPKDRYVIGDISSSNPDFLEPVGNLTPDEVYNGYREQALGLLDGGVDLIAVSGNHIDESVLAIKAVKDIRNIPILTDNVFYLGKKGFRTMMGLDPITASAKLQEAGADVVGFACGLMTKSCDSSEWYPGATALLKEMKQGTDRYLRVLPDAGLPELIDGKTVWPASPEEMASEVPNWVNTDARIIGGCCGTTLEHLRKISAVLREMRVKSA